MMNVLALDLGTSSCRSALFDATGLRIEGTTAQRQYRLRTDRAGRAELDPDEVLAELTACIADTLSAHARLGLGAIRAVATSCFWHSLIGVNAAGKPVTPIITWADSRCRDDAETLRKRLDEKTVHGRTGCMLRSSFWPAKLRWLARTDASRVKRVVRWLSPTDWLYAQLLGLSAFDVHTAHGMATGTGLYDPARRAWDPGMLSACKLRSDQLPLIGDEDVPPLNCRFSELRTARWIPAIGDGAANNLGAGATQPGLAAINFGTSGAVRIVRSSGKPKAPFGLFCYRIDRERYLIGGAISNAGGLRAWCLDHLKLPDEDELEAELASRPGPSGGLHVLPFWMAERAPTWREDLSGTISGISQATSAIDLYQAITEATYHRLATIIELIPQKQALTCIVGGGIQRSKQALQRLADVTGQTLVACDEAETSLRGAAVLALERLGAKPAAIGGRTVKPRARWAAAFADERKKLVQLERTLHG
jgi:gluconokinase